MVNDTVPKTVGISWMPVSFIIPKEKLLSTPEFMLMKWLRVRLVESFKMGMVTRRPLPATPTEYREGERGAVGLQIKFYRNSWTSTKTGKLPGGRRYPHARRVVHPIPRGQKLLLLGPFWTLPHKCFSSFGCPSVFFYNILYNKLVNKTKHSSEFHQAL